MVHESALSRVANLEANTHLRFLFGLFFSYLACSKPLSFLWLSFLQPSHGMTGQPSSSAPSAFSSFPLWTVSPPSSQINGLWYIVYMCIDEKVICYLLAYTMTSKLTVRHTPFSQRIPNPFPTLARPFESPISPTAIKIQLQWNLSVMVTQLSSHLIMTAS